MNNDKKSSIRFKGFTDDWKQCQLEEIADVTKLAGFEFTKYVIYSDKGNIIALRGLNVKNGRLILDDIKYIDESDFTKLHRSKLFKEDVLFTYVGTIGELAVIPEDNKYYLAPNVARIRIYKSVDSMYIVQLMGSNKFYNRVIFPLIATSSQPALSMENIRKFLIKLPNLEEQKKIGTFFKNLDELITLCEHKCKKLKNIKKAMLENMFPKEGFDVPKIRFKGFADSWKYQQLGEIYEKVSEKNDLRYGTDKIISVANMYFKSEVYISDKDYLKTYNIFKIGDIAFEGNKSKDFAHGRFVENTIGNGIVSHVFDVFRPKIKFDLQFWKYAINNDRLMGNILTRCTKASTMMTNLVATDFLKEYFFVPLFEEQKKIGIFFKHLDSLISLYQRKLEKLKNIKKAMLEKMFI